MQIEVFRNAFHEFFEPDAFNLRAIIGMSEFVPLGFYEKQISISPVYDNGSLRSSHLMKST